MIDPSVPHGSEELKASPEALNFLSSIGSEDVEQCLFVDSLETVSDTGRNLGEFSVSVEKASYKEEPCYLIHAKSDGMIDNIPCGTSITAYISTRLETLEENHDEHMKLQEHTLDRKVHILRQDDQLVVNKVITEKEEVKKEAFTFSLNSLHGFVSEALNLLLLRILARLKKIPENMLFLSFDTDTQIRVSTYRELEEKKQMIGEDLMNVFGIERTVSSAEHISTSWHCYFLPDGHLASRVQVGSPVTMNLVELPPVVSEERQQKPKFEKKPLIWEEDMELCSKFIDRKEVLKADHSSYNSEHPELKKLLADFAQSLLLRKPQNVFSFARDFFAPFSPHYSLDSNLEPQNLTVPPDNNTEPTGS